MRDLCPIPVHSVIRQQPNVTTSKGFVFVLVFQGGLVLLSSLLEGVLTASAVAEITCVGSLMILALGLNLLGITKIKVANYFPALILAPCVCALFELLGKYIPALA